MSFNSGCGRWTRTIDLRVMSPTSCQLLHPAIFHNAHLLYKYLWYLSIHFSKKLQVVIFDIYISLYANNLKILQFCISFTGALKYIFLFNSRGVTRLGDGVFV